LILLKFPFDDQVCTIVFGSWSFTQKYLNYSLMNEETALAGYVENSEWSLVQYKGIRKEIVYEHWIEKDGFSEIHYKLLITRKPLFVLQNYCIPAVMLCIILLYLFYVPFPQQILLSINIMLTFSILKLR
jgi:nicotinic acetylcholine receptor